MRAGSNWRHLNGLSLGMMGDPVRCLPKVVHPDVAALKLQHNRNDRETSIRELAETVKRVTGSRSEITTTPYAEAYEAGFEDMPRRVPDLRKIKARLGWSPTVSLEELLEKVVKHEGRRAPQAPAGRVSSS